MRFVIDDKHLKSNRFGRNLEEFGAGLLPTADLALNHRRAANDGGRKP